MQPVMLKLASLLLTYAGFALFQAVSRRQPLTAPLAGRLAAVGQRGRSGARLLALASVILACLVLVPAIGWTEACLLTTIELMIVASLFVVLAPIAPRIVWPLALAAPPVAGLLAFGARWIS